LKNRKLELFGNSLKKSRIQAGYQSLSQALCAIQKTPGTVAFSKATLHLIEKGGISDLNPSFLKTLCEAYGLDYRAKLEEYIGLKFDLPKGSFSKESRIIKKTDKESLMLHSESENDKGIEIITLRFFRKIQSNLPEGSVIGVSSNNFLDDHETFLQMVSDNIKKGIRYYYYLPEESELRYRKFISVLSMKVSLPPGEIDNSLCLYIKRGLSEFPLNSVLHILPDHTIEGYVGLVSGDLVQYYHKADILLSWRLYQAFLMAFSLSLDSETQTRRQKINADLQNNKSLKGFPILMHSLGT
jgi:hypothetical protein